MYCRFCGSKWQIWAIIIRRYKKETRVEAHFRPLQREADFHSEIRIISNKQPDSPLVWAPCDIIIPASNEKVLYISEVFPKVAPVNWKSSEN